MPRTLNLVGKKFNMLTVLEKTNQRERGMVVWKCQCDCGNICYVAGTKLRDNRVKSCGCLVHQSKAFNLIGQKFGKLIPLKNTGKKTSNRSAIWLCQCDCGNKIEVSQDSLRHGTKSCGCLQREVTAELGKSKKIDLTGEKYGKLTVLYELPNNIYNRTMWMCKCDCGNLIEVATRDLRRGNTGSCGCKSFSFGEIKISNLLKEANINFITQKTFEDGRYIQSNAKMKFDFYVNNKYIIEYDGLQHFQPVQFGGVSIEKAQQNYISNQERDKEKNQYCNKNKIPLIRIPYTHLNNLCLEDLLLNSSRFKIQEV